MSDKGCSKSLMAPKGFFPYTESPRGNLTLHCSHFAQSCPCKEAKSPFSSTGDSPVWSSACFQVAVICARVRDVQTVFPQSLGYVMHQRRDDLSLQSALGRLTETRTEARKLQHLPVGVAITQSIKALLCQFLS